MFVWRTLTVAHPLLDLRLFTIRIYTVAIASVFFTGTSLLGRLILLPLYWQLLRDQNAITTGLLMLAVGGAPPSPCPSAVT